jgi:hypothetical protein
MVLRAAGEGRLTEASGTRADTDLLLPVLKAHVRVGGHTCQRAVGGSEIGLGIQADVDVGGPGRTLNTGQRDVVDDICLSGVLAVEAARLVSE